jgi:phosphoenolpyruvate synthase/pyruvate phosphate dikinase
LIISLVISIMSGLTETEVMPHCTEKLVQWGITSVSVSPDMIDITREIIAKVEEKQHIKA